MISVLCDILGDILGDILLYLQEKGKERRAEVVRSTNQTY
jgi:hypothetical protein